MTVFADPSPRRLWRYWPRAGRGSAAGRPDGTEGGAAAQLLQAMAGEGAAEHVVVEWGEEDASEDEEGD